MLALPLVVELVARGLAVAPELIAAAHTELSLLASKSAPTALQLATINAALEKANAALQAA